jgi:hypothetical protein
MYNKVFNYIKDHCGGRATLTNIYTSSFKLIKVVSCFISNESLLIETRNNSGEVEYLRWYMIDQSVKISIAKQLNLLN